MLKVGVVKNVNGRTHEILVMEGSTMLEAIKNIQDEDISNDIYRRAGERAVNENPEFDDVDWPLEPDSYLGKRYAAALEDHLEEAFDDFLNGNGYWLVDVE